ncbi:hypothetical protein [Thermoflavimicrobium dichotomicum]|uniref:Lipoprotein n=1 Tax=Thermoflavimicrobium dichotomicum TaxID=46223 RepID=A0A1I3MDD1_9BACL|nr:hypothetical protein [Thermoflavimicrobium dichotomicum]SFI94725.1 hypothetical protein SAMN05421852_1033 [Thermoflavimicrobium dichotomicum]
MRKAKTLVILIWMLSLVGCGLLPSKDQEKEVHPKAVSLNKTYPEIRFKLHFFDSYVPPRRSTGGIWLYTKEKHAGDIDQEFNWDQTDVLHIQISDSKYNGYSATPLNIQLMDEKTVRVIVKLEKGTDPFQKETDAPRMYIEVEKGKLNEDMKFIVEKDTGETLRTK